MAAVGESLSIFILFSTVQIQCLAVGGVSMPWQNNKRPLPYAFDDLLPRFHQTIDNLPEQIHLSLGNDAYTMAVLWSTLDEYDEGPSYVHYGLGKDNFTLRSTATAEDLRNGNPLGCKGVFHAVMTNLVPRRIHSYMVETGGHFSRKFTFRHPDNEANRSASFLVYGDLGKVGGGHTVNRLIREANSNKYDAVIHSGDFAYNFHDDGGRVGDDFMNRIEPIASKLPYMHCVGNHEIEYDFIHYRHRLSSPNVPWPIPKYRMWYSFDMGPVHFISYSTEAYFTDNQAFISAQFGWLKEDLLNANRQRDVRPWIIVFGHRPMYCSNFDNDDCTKNMSLLRMEPYNLERLFYTEGVDLIVEAHEHSYERLYPLYNGTQTDCGYRNPRAPVHVIAGSAGCSEREMLCADVMLQPAGPWSAKRSWLPGLNGYARLHVINSTHLHWEQVMSITDQPLDQFTLIQEHHHRRDVRNVTEYGCTDKT